MARTRTLPVFTKESVLNEVLSNYGNLTAAILTISSFQDVDEMEAGGTTHLNYRGWNLADGAQMSAVTERIYAGCATVRDLDNSISRILKYWKRLGRCGFGTIIA